MTRPYLDLRVGDAIPLDRHRGLVAGPLMAEAVWYALVVPPMREAAARAALRAAGVYAFLPEREKSWRVRGRTVRRKFPIVSGIVYARFDRAPQWDVLRDRRLITGFIASGDMPVAIPRELIRRIQGLAADIEALEAAKREMVRIREGDTAEITEGPFAGMAVSITRTAQGRAWFETATGIKGEVPTQRLRRVDGEG